MALSTSSPTVLSIFDSHLTMSDQQQYSQARHIGHQDQPRSYQLIKAATAVTAAGSLLVLSALILAGTVILLTVATPPLVIFSPVLVPAVITAGLILTGFLSSGGFGVAAVTVLSWIYRYMTGKHPSGADHLDQVRMKLAGKTREMKDRAEQFGQQHLYGQQQHLYGQQQHQAS